MKNNPQDITTKQVLTSLGYLLFSITVFIFTIYNLNKQVESRVEKEVESRIKEINNQKQTEQKDVYVVSKENFIKMLLNNNENKTTMKEDKK